MIDPQQFHENDIGLTDGCTQLLSLATTRKHLPRLMPLPDFLHHLLVHSSNPFEFPQVIQLDIFDHEQSNPVFDSRYKRFLLNFTTANLLDVHLEASLIESVSFGVPRTALYIC